jgi:flagellar protein FlaF
MHDPHGRAATAYAHGAKTTVDQRQLEAGALLKAASRLQDVRDRWQPEAPAGLDEALHYNQKLWTIFAAEVADGADRLPLDLRTNVGSLAMFVFKRTFEVMAAPAVTKIDALIEINRSLAAGLLSRETAPDGASQGAAPASAAPRSFAEQRC